MNYDTTTGTGSIPAELQLLLDAGIPLFPVWGVVNGHCACPLGTACNSPGKHPRTGEGGVHTASTDVVMIRAMLNQFPESNWGAAMGAGYFAVDIDNTDRWLEWTSEHAQLPYTLAATTGSGKRHLIFKTSQKVRGRNPWLRGSDGTKHVEVKSNGGYIVVAPSQHVAGGAYRWTTMAPIADAPDWLVEDINTRGKLDKAAPLPSITDSGGRHHALVSMAGTLRNRGLDYEQLLAMLSTYNHAAMSPPQDDADVDRIAQDYASYEVGEAPVHFSIDANMLEWVKATTAESSSTPPIDSAGRIDVESLPEPVQRELVRQKAQRVARDLLDAEELRAFGMSDADSVGVLDESALLELFDGFTEVERPELRAFDDEPERALWYRGRLNYIVGEPTSGKTWVALDTVVRELRAGGKVIYLDLGESDGNDVIGRLKTLGLSKDDIVSGAFAYVRLVAPPTDEQVRAIRKAAEDRSFAVFDSMSGLLGMYALSANKDDAVRKVANAIIVPIMLVVETGLVLDHVVKNADDRSRWGIGSGTKLAMITGVSYSVALKQSGSISSGTETIGELVVGKDRAAQVGSIGSVAGAFAISGDGTFTRVVVTKNISPAVQGVMLGNLAAANAESIELVFAWITANPGSKLKLIAGGIGKGERATKPWVEQLVAEGRVRSETGARNAVYFYAVEVA